MKDDHTSCSVDVAAPTMQETQICAWSIAPCRTIMVSALEVWLKYDVLLFDHIYVDR